VAELRAFSKRLSRAMEALRARKTRQVEEEEFGRPSERLEEQIRAQADELARVNNALRREVKQRKHVDEALHLYNEMLRHMGEGVVLVRRQDEVIVFTNPRFEEIFGYGPGELIGKNISVINAAGVGEEAQAVAAKMYDSLRDQWTWSGEVLSVKKDGTPFHCRTSVTTFESTRYGTVWVGIYEDITEQKRAERILRESEDQLRDLSSRLISAQEEERKRIAGELHDSIGSSLGAIKMGLENALASMEPDAPAARSIGHVVALAQECIHEVRRIMSDLRPSVLDDLGLLATITWFCRQFEALHPNIHLEREIHVEENNVPESLRIVIFRVIQEALHNVIKHSKAEFVALSLEKKGRSLELTIEDNGVGFDKNEAFSRIHDKGGLGLTSMRERVELSGGAYSIESSAGQGTVIRARWAEHCSNE